MNILGSLLAAIASTTVSSNHTDEVISTMKTEKPEVFNDIVNSVKQTLIDQGFLDQIRFATQDFFHSQEWQEILLSYSPVKGDQGIQGVQGIPGKDGITTIVYQNAMELVNIGDIVMSTTVKSSANFMLCDGSAVLRSSFPELFSLIGTSCGAGDSVTTFNLPNLTGKIIAGAADDPGIYNMPMKNSTSLVGKALTILAPVLNSSGTFDRIRRSDESYYISACWSKIIPSSLNTITSMLAKWTLSTAKISPNGAWTNSGTVDGYYPFYLPPTDANGMVQELAQVGAQLPVAGLSAYIRVK